MNKAPQGKLKKCRLSPDLAAKARILGLAGDPTRIRILSLLFQNPEVCVSDLASCLDMTVSAISHQLQLLKDNRVVETKRFGQNICYSLRRSDLTKRLEAIISA